MILIFRKSVRFVWSFYYEFNIDMSEVYICIGISIVIWDEYRYM